MKKPMQSDVRRAILWSVLFGIVFALGAAITVVSAWYSRTYDLEFKELLYTLASPLKGTGESTVDLVIGSCLPWVLLLIALYVGGAVFLWKKRHTLRLARRIGALLCVVFLIASSVFSVYALRVPAYLEARRDQTAIYENEYIDPATVTITADGKMKNLICIYLESMETTYASEALGGAQSTNYMPNLTALAASNLSFSDKSAGLLGGYHTPLGTGWTMSALLATTSGIPFSFPLGENGHNKMSKRENFASGLTTLGDILAEQGYRQQFLCGSNAAFAGRDTYFEQHGNYEIFDLDTAREEHYVPEGYHDGWWGFEDSILFDIAKDKLTELAAGSRPFNLTLLTVDLHHVGGHLCDLCENTHRNKTANVVSCTDRQVADFVSWCQSQAFYEDTVIIVVGDHPRMDTVLVAQTDYYDRTVYNCFINAVPTPQGATTERIVTSFDLFPTTLAAIGFSIEGNRLGFGVNLFSSEPTLAERLGYAYLETEINKFSEYYIREFS